MSFEILIVDDHEAMRMMLRRMLERAGAQVREAHNGAEALRALSQRGAHLVLCDQNMPGMSGIELVRTLRADRNQTRTRMMILSGNTEAGFTEAAQAAGADAVLAKPILPSKLLDAISQVMRAAA